MKALAMTVIFAVTVVTNAFCGNIQKEIAHNEEKNDDRVEAKKGSDVVTIYRSDNAVGSYHFHLMNWLKK